MKYYDLIENEVDAVVVYYRNRAADGFTLVEAFALTTRALATLVRLVKILHPDGKKLSNDQRKALILRAAERLYDEVIAPMNVPRTPNLVETPFVDPALRGAWMSLMDGLTDALLRIVPEAPALVSGVIPY